MFLEHTDTSRDSVHTRVGLGIGGRGASVSATVSSLGSARWAVSVDVTLIVRSFGIPDVIFKNDR